MMSINLTIFSLQDDLLVWAFICTGPGSRFCRRLFIKVCLGRFLPSLQVLLFLYMVCIEVFWLICCSSNTLVGVTFWNCCITFEITFLFLSLDSNSEFSEVFFIYLLLDFVKFALKNVMLFNGWTLFLWLVPIRKSYSFLATILASFFRIRFNFLHNIVEVSRFLQIKRRSITVLAYDHFSSFQMFVFVHSLIGKPS